MVYEGKLWPMDAKISDMHLQLSSRVHLLEDPDVCWPQGVTRVADYTWEELDDILAFRKLNMLLEDHTNSLDWILQGLDNVISRLVVPEEEWDGTIACD